MRTSTSRHNLSKMSAKDAKFAGKAIVGFCLIVITIIGSLLMYQYGI